AFDEGVDDGGHHRLEHDRNGDDTGAEEVDVAVPGEGADEGSHAEAEGQQVDRGFHDRGEGGGTPGLAVEDPFAGHDTAHGVEFETAGTHVGVGAGVIPCLLQAQSTFTPVRASITASILLSLSWGVPTRTRS